MQKPGAEKKGAQDSAATEEAALRLGNGSWPAFQSLRLGAQVVGRNRAAFAASGALSIGALAGFLAIPRGPAPGPEVMAAALALLAGLGHAVAIETTQRDLLGAPARTSAEAALQWCARLPALIGVILLMTGVVWGLDLALTPLMKATAPLGLLVGADLLMRFTGFTLHEVVAGERNPLRAFFRGARVAGFPLRAAAARGGQWLAMGAAGWGLGLVMSMAGAAFFQMTRSAAGTSYAARQNLEMLAMCILVPLGITAVLYWTSWVQASWSSYHLLRKEELSCDA